MSATALKVVPIRPKYPRSDCPVRPYHLWNANKRCRLPHRFYSDSKRAHQGALIECRWAKSVGTTIEVFNASTGRLLGQYTLGVNGIRFRGED